MLHAAENKNPKGLNVLRLKTYGLFYVAPAQDSFMCRLLFHGGILAGAHLRKVAEVSTNYGGAYTDITTRANLQIHEIQIENAPNLITDLQDAGSMARQRLGDV